MLQRLNRALNKAYMPVAFKYISLAVYAVLIITGLAAYSTDAVFLKQLRNTNFGNLIVWSYWWPVIVFLSIFFGRIWCMVCPVEVITTFFARIGLKKKRPVWLLSGWAITIFYILILFIGIQGFAIHRNPYFMAIYLLTIVGVSIVIGSIYEKNTFCRYVCPVGYLLGMYSKLSFVGWRVKDPSTCESCKDKSCIHKNYRYNLNYKSCGVDLYPASLDDNSTCILCSGCRKTCNKYQSKQNTERPNPQLTYIGFSNDLFGLKALKIAELFFILIVSGFVISEIWSEWAVTDNYLGYLPGLMKKVTHMDTVMLSGFINALLLFFIFPLLIWLIPFLISKLSGATVLLKEYFLTYGIAFIPIIAAAHLDKAILKTTSRLPYFEHLFSDITGVTTAKQIIEGKIKLHDNPTWVGIIVSMMLTLVMMGGIWLSIMVVKKLNMKKSQAGSKCLLYLIPAIYGGIFLVMIFVWRWF